MCLVSGDDQGMIEKDLLALRWGYIMLLLAFGEVSGVPLKTNTSCQQIDDTHDLCIYVIYTICQGFRWWGNRPNAPVKLRALTISRRTAVSFSLWLAGVHLKQLVPS